MSGYVYRVSVVEGRESFGVLEADPEELAALLNLAAINNQAVAFVNGPDAAGKFYVSTLSMEESKKEEISP